TPFGWPPAPHDSPARVPIVAPWVKGSAAGGGGGARGQPAATGTAPRGGGVCAPHMWHAAGGEWEDVLRGVRRWPFALRDPLAWPRRRKRLRRCPVVAEGDEGRLAPCPLVCSPSRVCESN